MTGNVSIPQLPNEVDDQQNNDAVEGAGYDCLGERQLTGNGLEMVMPNEYDPIHCDDDDDSSGAPNKQHCLRICRTIVIPAGSRKRVAQLVSD
ncbi:hypothetical protein D3C87_1938730 [compost metagenome]